MNAVPSKNVIEDVALELGIDAAFKEVVCIDPVENAADKLSALIWRVPDRNRTPEDDDPDLVRHIHDLAALQPYAISHPGFRELARITIEQDDARCGKTKGMSLDKKAQLLLEILMTDTGYRTEYTRFVQGMSYALGGGPTYDEALAKLKKLMDHLS